ncbi:phosphatidylserine decarboxylase family protein [Mycobacterium paragordonae]|uniref:phosphatidylserine decarboxylase n=1 Tax=Mycobacterium paragordonae TaxID=1389713 RepID=UPI000EA95E2F|nr:phosphatidylserine decarboxylase [Mycobacterium paragordonae]AYE98542.1 phosphatidylserine decarboxylase family protein [Mycobacterium paragordonae]
MARRPGSSQGPAHLIELVRDTVPPIHPGGRPFIGAGLALAAVGHRHRWLRRTGLLAAGACAGFFRHPKRVPPTRPGAVVAPADGTVCVIDTAVPPAELSMGDTPRPRISIFLSILDVHVQRAPVSGEVVAVQHRPGSFLSADLPEASEANERTSVRIRMDLGDEGPEVVAVQIAGLVARRIVCDAHVGDRLTIGETYGLIRFGSRLDIYLPPGAQPIVNLGQRTLGGETVLAELS